MRRITLLSLPYALLAHLALRAPVSRQALLYGLGVTMAIITIAGAVVGDNVAGAAWHLLFLGVALSLVPRYPDDEPPPFGLWAVTFELGILWGALSWIELAWYGGSALTGREMNWAELDMGFWSFCAFVAAMPRPPRRCVRVRKPAWTGAA